MKDLRDWLQAAEKAGEVVRIAKEVDWDEEMGAIVYMGSQQPDAPAYLFEKVKDSPPGYQALFNVFGSLDKLALALRLPTGKSPLEIIQLFRDKLGKRIEPKVVDARSAPINENIDFGNDVDLYKFPAPKMWPLDGGRYIGSADAVITRNPDTGVMNLGTYRQMIQSRNEVGFWISPGKDGLLHREAWWRRGEPCEVAVAYGMDPLLFAVSSLHYPKNLSEYEFAGGIQGEPIEVVKGEVTDLLIPAHAEVVIEGLAYPNNVKEEGPFGEFNGYYGRPAAPTPVIDVKCVHYRNQPILTNSLVANYPCEPGLFHAVAKSASVWDNFMTLGIPGIKGVYMPPGAASGMAMLVVSLQQMYAGHSAQVAAVAAQCTASAYFTKWIVVVDDDVDPTDINQVLWAMSTRCSPTDDIDILRNTWSTYLDPTLNPPEERPYGSKALINACKEHKYLNVFSRKTNIMRDTYDRVKARWTELGLKGAPPELIAFEDKRS